MKRVLIAGALALAARGQAFAADLPPPMAPPPPRAPAMYVPTIVPYYNWGGIYLGINGGYGFGNSTWTAGATSTGNFATSGFLVGGTVGANFQTGPLVLGIEGDADWQNLKGTTTTVCGGCETKSNMLGTVRGRIGYAFDRILVYGTGGGAFGNIQAGPNPPGTTFDSATNFGWTTGAGVEFAFAPNWTAKAEYLFVDLTNGSCNAACGSPVTPIAVKFSESLVRLGLNYKFGF